MCSSVRVYECVRVFEKCVRGVFEEEVPQFRKMQCSEMCSRTVFERSRNTCSRNTCSSVFGPVCVRVHLRYIYIYIYIYIYNM